MKANVASLVCLLEPSEPNTPTKPSEPSEPGESSENGDLGGERGTPLATAPTKLIFYLLTKVLYLLTNLKGQRGAALAAVELDDRGGDAGGEEEGGGSTRGWVRGWVGDGWKEMGKSERGGGGSGADCTSSAFC